MRGINCKINDNQQSRSQITPLRPVDDMHAMCPVKSKAPRSELMDELNCKRAWVLSATTLEFRH